MYKKFLSALANICTRQLSEEWPYGGKKVLKSLRFHLMCSVREPDRSHENMPLEKISLFESKMVFIHVAVGSVQ